MYRSILTAQHPTSGTFQLLDVQHVGVVEHVPQCFMNTSNPSASSCRGAESNSNLFGAGGGLEVHLRVPHVPGQHLFYVAGQDLHLLLESHVGTSVRKLPVA